MGLAMQRTIIVLVLIIIAVAFLGFVALPWFKSMLGLDSKDVIVKVLSAFQDDDVVVPGTNGKTVPRIVTGNGDLVSLRRGAPDSITDLTIRDDEDRVVDVDWGRSEPQKYDVEGRAQTKLIVRECFFRRISSRASSSANRNILPT